MATCWNRWIKADSVINGPKLRRKELKTTGPVEKLDCLPNVGVPNCVEVEILDPYVDVGCFRLTVEEKGEVIGRVNLSEYQRCAKRRVGADKLVVDAKATQSCAYVLTEPVVTNASDHRTVMPIT